VRIFQLGIAGILLATVSTAYADVKCEVTFKAKKVEEKRYFLSSVPVPKYKVGRVESAGSTLKKCRKNATKALTSDGWTITSSSYKRTN